MSIPMDWQQANQAWTPFGIPTQPLPAQQPFSFPTPTQAPPVPNPFCFPNPPQPRTVNPFGFTPTQAQAPPAQQPFGFLTPAQPQPANPFGFGTPAHSPASNLFGQVLPQQPFLFGVPQGQVQQPIPATQFHLPPHGAASPLAIEYLRSIGLVYQPNAFLSPPPTYFPQPQPLWTPPLPPPVVAQPVAHPASIFPETSRGDSGRNETGKFVFVDVESLAKVLQKKSCSLERIPPRESFKVVTPFEQYRNRLALERNRADWPPANSPPRPLSTSDEEFSPRRCVIGGRGPSSVYDDFMESRRSWSAGRQTLPRPSLFDNHARFSPEASGFELFPRGGNSVPPRTNEGTETRRLFSGRWGQVRDYNWNRQSLLVGNLPYRFPAQTTILPEHPPRRSRSSEWSCRHEENVTRIERPLPPGWWNLIGLDAPPRRTPSGNFNSNVTLTKRDYYCKPSISELNRMTGSDGSCIVNKFQIGHSVWGKIIYEDNFDVSGLNLGQLVEFGESSVRVYPPGCQSPAVGQGLNRPATIVLSRVFPLDPISNRPILNASRLQQFDFLHTLRQKTGNFGGTFVSYDPDAGDWTFKVPYMAPPTLRSY